MRRCILHLQRVTFLGTRKTSPLSWPKLTGFDLKARQVMVAQPGGRKVTHPYDSLIVAAEIRQSYFGHDEIRTGRLG